MKREYIVTWRIELTAESPHDAVQKARKMQLNPETNAAFYEVAIKWGVVTDKDKS